MLSIILSIVSAILLTNIFKHKNHSEILNNHHNNICIFISLINSKMIETYDVYDAYSMIENQLPVDFINMSENDFYDQLDEIVSNYNSSGFKMYVNNLKIYRNNDVNYYTLIAESTKLCFKERKEIELLNKKKYNILMQINYLYVLWIALLVFIKICITDYYNLMISSTIYQILFCVILLLGQVFYYFAYKEYLK